MTVYSDPSPVWFKLVPYTMHYIYEINTYKAVIALQC